MDVLFVQMILYAWTTKLNESRVEQPRVRLRPAGGAFPPPHRGLSLQQRQRRARARVRDRVVSVAAAPCRRPWGRCSRRCQSRWPPTTSRSRRPYPRSSRHRRRLALLPSPRYVFGVGLFRIVDVRRFVCFLCGRWISSRIYDKVLFCLCRCYVMLYLRVLSRMFCVLKIVLF